MKNIATMLRMFLFVLCLAPVSYAEALLPDEPETTRELPAAYPAVDSYPQALATWKTAEDISQWVAAHFRYDRVRAIKLASGRKTRNISVPIYTPTEFFEAGSGICVDLARFGVETLKAIDPDSSPRYLMIEFEAIQINGNTFRLHWLAGFTEGGMKYFFCDSKRPGHLAGPYHSTQAFIDEYEQYRHRKIIAHREQDSYQKKRKSQSVKQRITGSAGKAGGTADR